jgi:hypothetical protein
VGVIEEDDGGVTEEGEEKGEEGRRPLLRITSRQGKSPNLSVTILRTLSEKGGREAK